jgi:hypothetical protein
MTITIQSEGRRHYLLGNTYPIKDQLRSAGAHWDADRKAWWTSKRDVAERLAGGATGASDAAGASGGTDGCTGASDRLTEDSRIAGKAIYKGKPYILVWSGDTRRGPAAKLAFADGSKVFWASLTEVQITKRYQERENYRTGRTEPMTFGRLQRLRAEFQRAKAEGNDDGIPNGRRYCCDECGEWVTRGDGSSCWETGAAH